jgi:hypothetical protein
LAPAIRAPGPAARALGVLHDRASVEGLIGLTSSDDALVAQAASTR